MTSTPTDFPGFIIRTWSFLSIKINAIGLHFLLRHSCC